MGNQIKWIQSSKGLKVFVYHANVWKWMPISAKKAQVMIEAGQAVVANQDGKVWF
jgi:hypothetical protein